MNRCNPVEMRKALVLVDALKMAGIEFVPVPVFNEKQKQELGALCSLRLESLDREVII